MDELTLARLADVGLLESTESLGDVQSVLLWTLENMNRVFSGYDGSLILTTSKCLLRRRGITFDGEKLKENLEVLIYQHELMTGEKIASRTSGLDEVDRLSGVEFEELIGSHFEAVGYSVEYTPASGDQGADLIIQNESERIAVQIKRYSGNVGNGAIQEVVAAMSFYDADSCMVITNSYFTESAVALAEANRVVLMDRNWVSANLCL